MRNELTIFDFDGTLLRKDTFQPLTIFFVRKQWRYHLLFLFLLFYLLFKMNLLDTLTLKRIFAFLFLRGRRVSQIRYLVKSFWREKFHSLVDYRILKTFQDSLSAGKRVLIISASFSFVVEEFCRYVGAGVEVLSTPVMSKGERFTGKVGEECKGEMKVLRLFEQIENRNGYFIEVFSDNSSDIPLFSIADRAFKVWKDRRIEKVSLKGDGI